MAKAEELKDLLKKLRAEVSYSNTDVSPEAGPDFRKIGAVPEWGVSATLHRESTSNFLRYNRETDLQKGENKIPFNAVWSENKETVIFGILASVLVILAGIISSTDYLVLVGAIGFLLFVFIMFLLMLRYAASLRKSPKTNINVEAVEKRIDALERKISGLSYQKGSQIGWSKEKELEDKIEELRTIVKSISNTITQWK